jgi:hypothetical protein
MSVGYRTQSGELFVPLGWFGAGVDLTIETRINHSTLAKTPAGSYWA